MQNRITIALLAALPAAIALPSIDSEPSEATLGDYPQTRSAVIDAYGYPDAVLGFGDACEFSYETEEGPLHLLLMGNLVVGRIPAVSWAPASGEVLPGMNVHEALGISGRFAEDWAVSGTATTLLVGDRELDVFGLPGIVGDERPATSAWPVEHGRSW
ncbi:MAG: hypothetical protein ACYSWX_14385 [Planctomycetota bacterium]|jgi:hypothetical protein